MEFFYKLLGLPEVASANGHKVDNFIVYVHWLMFALFAFPPEIRKLIYTTNAIESLNSKVRTAVRSRGHFPNDDAAIKLIFLVLRRIEQNWKMP